MKKKATWLYVLTWWYIFNIKSIIFIQPLLVISKIFPLFFWKSEDTTISIWDFLTFSGQEEPVEVINEEGEEDLEATEDAGDDKYEEPKQITVQIEEQSRRPRQSCNKNLFESKSMTNLKPERLSMKRRHRFSGNNQSIYLL